MKLGKSLLMILAILFFAACGQEEITSTVTDAAIIPATNSGIVNDSVYSFVENDSFQKVTYNRKIFVSTSEFEIVSEVNEGWFGIDYTTVSENSLSDSIETREESETVIIHPYGNTRSLVINEILADFNDAEYVYYMGYNMYQVITSTEIIDYNLSLPLSLNPVRKMGRSDLTGVKVDTYREIIE